MRHENSIEEDVLVEFASVFEELEISSDVRDGILNDFKKQRIVLIRYAEVDPYFIMNEAVVKRIKDTMMKHGLSRGVQSVLVNAIQCRDLVFRLYVG